ncbi:MAG: FliM/FliN family flagellar motor switch protein [Spirochaetaceae bacterium]|nr:MAG: FliM/FliN family flagellar motor switch protein [Spirochaetaceae bacterium]
MSGNLETFLSDSTMARRVRADARVVIRRFDASPRAVGAAIDSGRVEIEAQPVCELVVGNTLVARGEIVTENGARAFRVTEVVE